MEGTQASMTGQATSLMESGSQGLFVCFNVLLLFTYFCAILPLRSPLLFLVLSTHPLISEETFQLISL